MQHPAKFVQAGDFQVPQARLTRLDAKLAVGALGHGAAEIFAAKGLSCVLASGDDDAIDTLDSDVTVENCILRDWPNPNEDAKGVSAFHGEVILRRCLVVNCFVGVSAKSSGALAVVRFGLEAGSVFVT